jgi:membrane associated rhomboid family serine protease
MRVGAQERVLRDWFGQKRPIPKLKDTPKYPVITAVMVLATGVSIAWWAHADISLLFEDAQIRRGELWRLLTSIFPHANIWHLAFNLYWLWVFGTLIESVYGHAKTAAILLLFSVVSNSFEFALWRGGVGLSGAVYGLFGMLWMLSKRDDRFRDAVSKNMVFVFLLWFLYCIEITLKTLYPIGNIAHGAGLLIGMLVGALSGPALQKALKPTVAAVVICGLIAATVARPLINHTRYAGNEEENWGLDALKANNNQEAVRWLRDAVLYQPSKADYSFNLGVAYFRTGDKTRSDFFFQQAHESDPDKYQVDGKRVTKPESARGWIE